MQIKASVAALMLAFAGTTAWAGANDPEQNTASPSSLDPAGVAQAPTGWQYMNGEPAADAGQGSEAAASQSDTDEQAKTSLGFTEGDQSDDSDQAAQAEDSDKMAGTEQPKGEETSAASGDTSSDDAAAMGDEEEDRLEAAKGDEEGQERQAGASDQSGDEDQAATSDESGATTAPQAAGSDDSVSDQYTAEQQDGTTPSEGSDQPGMSEDQSGAPASQSEDSADQPAHSPREPDSSGQAAMSEDAGSDQSAQAQDGQSGDQAADSATPAALQGKVVVIIPRDWEGSLEGLLSALQTSPDAKDIVIVQQGQPDDPQASSAEEPGDTYEASRARPLNQQ